MKIEAVLFDMDGVLIDSFKAWYSLFNFTLNHYNKKVITKNEFKERVWAQDLNILADHYFNGILKDDLIKFYFSNFLSFKKNLTTLPNAQELLEYLTNQSIKTAVVSNTQRNLQRKMLESANILRYFDATIGADNVRNGKPAPDMVKLALKQLNVKSQQALMVGDTIYDKKAAQSAAVRFIGYKMGDIKDLIEIKKYI